MEPHTEGLARRKRRRRRRQNRLPVSAHLLLDERLKEDIGILSEDLFSDLFPDNTRLQGTVIMAIHREVFVLTDYV